jgi:hemicentin
MPSYPDPSGAESGRGAGSSGLSGGGDSAAKFAPVFTAKTRQLQSFYKKQPGESFSLDCEALGDPAPSIIWLHDMEPVAAPATGGGAGRSREGGQLRLASVTVADSGIYTCLATSPAGQASRQFSLTVESPHVELPLIGQFSNMTARAGEPVTWRCEVRSRLGPEIQWLKQTDGSHYSISLGRRPMLVLLSYTCTVSVVYRGYFKGFYSF